MSNTNVKFKYLDHTADIKIQSFGKNLEETFVNSALGAFNYITDVSKVKKLLEFEINIESKRIESLLYDFFDELLFLTDTKNFIFSGAKNMKIQKKEDGSYVLTATVLGDDYKKYETKGDLKAVTYSDMSIKEKNGEWEIIIVMDI